MRKSAGIIQNMNAFMVKNVRKFSGNFLKNKANLMKIFFLQSKSSSILIKKIFFFRRRSYLLFLIYFKTTTKKIFELKFSKVEKARTNEKIVYSSLMAIFWSRKLFYETPSNLTPNPNFCFFTYGWRSGSLCTISTAMVALKFPLSS